eukprot:TRINITY_DN13501_c0_g1_i1.p1 TRINITY_DN13501_c0_g1~~TRINITY_DN13501_c0_g1_i1.p1  ORF type:complete len:537 (-),score=118.80 TRINITY_DN13501_c0_g1_i1:43-1605(-)
MAIVGGAAVIATPPPPVADGRCNFFLAGKGRHCRFQVVPGLARCGAHRDEDNHDVDDRIPCPLDPSHTVYRKRLNQHLKCCTKLRENGIVEQQPFFKRGVNAGTSMSESPKVPVSAAAPEVIEAWMDRIVSAYPRAVREVLGPSADADALLELSVLTSADSRGDVGHADKHGVQNLALARLAAQSWPAEVDENGGVDCDNSGGGGASTDDRGILVVEFGCGKGGLGAAVLQTRPEARCVLVDREPRRHKMENKQEIRSEERTVLRLRSDITDFDLGALLWTPLDLSSLPRAADFHRGAALKSASSSAVVANGGGGDTTNRNGPAERLEDLWKVAATLQSQPWPPPKLLACAKHLCGGATDIALRALRGARVGSNARTMDVGGDDSVVDTSTVHVDVAVCVATCCHHRCDGSSYVNVPFLTALGIIQSPADVAELASTAGWAVGGCGTPEGLARRRAGMMTKRILDLGRVLWLREEIGLADASLTCYISKAVTPENIAIVAGRRCAEQLTAKDTSEPLCEA